MGQISRAKRGQRARRQEERRIKIITDRLKNRMDQSLRETICLQHNFQMRDEVFMKSQEEVCEVIACSEEVMELEVSEYFPAEGMTLSVIGNFMEWLSTPKGESIRPVCLPWCRKWGQLVIECGQCRGGAPKETSQDGRQGPEAVRAQKARAVVDFILSGEEPTDPMMVDPDVVAMSSGKIKRGGGLAAD